MRPHSSQGVSWLVQGTVRKQGDELILEMENAGGTQLPSPRLFLLTQDDAAMKEHIENCIDKAVILEGYWQPDKETARFSGRLHVIGISEQMRGDSQEK